LKALGIASLAIRNLRNVERADFLALPRFTVLSGHNGQGKTTLLEAIYLVCTSRSFRTAKLAETIAHGAPAASVRAIFAEGAEGDTREQVIGLQGARRKVTLNGKRPPSLASYAVQSPVVVFHPGELMLSSGPAGKRRTLLDRIALFVDPSSSDHLQRYMVASRARQRLLETRGSAATGLDAFEKLMAVHGSAVGRARAGATERLAGELVRAFSRITHDARSLEARYDAGGPEDEQALEEMLAMDRDRDRRRGSAGAGPHRDDLELRLGGHDVRSYASQGEHRAVTMALKMAELWCIAEVRGVQPMLLLDDVSSELDVARTALLFDYLRESPGQILLTTTRPELIETPGYSPDERRDYRLQGGVVTAVGS
jgi:DNA replication and repair protein RecF